MRRLCMSRAFLAGLLLAGAGCDTVRRDDVPPPAQVVTLPPSVHGDIVLRPRPARPPERPRVAREAERGAEKAVADESGDQMAAVIPSRGLDIRGFSETETRLMLGDPVEERLRVPSKVWRYRAKACEIDVFLSLDLERQTYRVLDTTVVRADAADMPPGHCLGLIREARRVQS